jgi:glycerophosphoryl diester phosphodiesterase
VSDAPARGPLRIGHKGAHAIVPGNTLESFRAAVEMNVDVIELDVLRPRSDFAGGPDWRRAPAGRGARGSKPLLVAHDWGDAASREALTLEQVLDAFLEPPLDRVRLDLDLKVAGREDEVAAAIRERSLESRAMASTMEVGSIRELHRLIPELELGWTVPKSTRDWPSIRWARPLLAAALVSLRSRLPRLARRQAPELGVSSIWAYHPVITARLVDACHGAGLKLNAWTVDDALMIGFLTDLGVDGICTNDPRLFAASVAEPMPSRDN